MRQQVMRILKECTYAFVVRLLFGVGWRWELIALDEILRIICFPLEYRRPTVIIIFYPLFYFPSTYIGFLGNFLTRKFSISTRWESSTGARKMQYTYIMKFLCIFNKKVSHENQVENCGRLMQVSTFLFS